MACEGANTLPIVGMSCTQVFTPYHFRDHLDRIYVTAHDQPYEQSCFDDAMLIDDAMCQSAYHPPTAEYPYSSLIGALGEYEYDHQIWYETPDISPHWVEVPQRPYTTPSHAFFTPQDTIRFSTPTNGGILVSDIQKGDWPVSWESEPMPTLSPSGSMKITCRINWPDYPAFSMSINVRDDTRDRKPITKTKLAMALVKAILRMLGEAGSYRSTSEQWKVEYNTDLSDVMIAELRHVSDGSWQPTLYLRSKAGM